MPLISCVSLSLFSFVLGLVDQMFWRSCLRWPLSLAGDSGRWRQTAAAVRPGHVENWLLLIAFIQVDIVGEKHIGVGT